MSFKNPTPIRQVKRAYGALLNIAASLDSMPEQQRAIAEQAQAAVDEAVAKILDAAAAMTPPAPVPATVDTFERMGLRLLLDQTSMLDKRLVDSGEWEMEQITYISSLIERLRGKASPVFLDIGAYWGLYSLIAHRSGAFEQIHAFEADRHNFAQLQANLFLNKATKIITSHNKAVGEKDGTLFVWDSTAHPDGSRAGVGIVDEASGLPGFRTPSVAIDSALSLSGCHVLMKIDVESFEPYVLRGLTETVAKNRVFMQVEVYDENKEPVFKEIERLGLRQIHCIYPDYYLTNMSPEELGL